MARYLSWLVNGSLLVICCFLVARTANAVLAAWLAPAAEEIVASQTPAEAPADRWADHQAILERNLFHSTTAAPDLAAEALREQLEETKLPLGLLGTVASPNPKLSWAAVEDQEARTHLVLRVGDAVKGQATVERIERKRIVLRENGKLRELTLDEETDVVAAAGPQTPAARRNAAAMRRRMARRAPPVVPPTPPATPPATVQPLDQPPELNTAQLFSQAQILPKYENGAMVGVQVSAIQAGSALSNYGLQDGDVITARDGQPLDSPESAASLLGALGGGQPFTVTVVDKNGAARDVPVHPSQLSDPAQPPAQE